MFLFCVTTRKKKEHEFDQFLYVTSDDSYITTRKKKQ